ncbi:probable peptidase [uncultured Mediterranean phage uvMED]|nr:probable peptidase [uncultured Mediterranean phage uvMED]
MKLDVIRTQFGKDATNGMLFIDGVFECYTLEDEVREEKVYGETAIPEGTYDIKFRTEGTFTKKYQTRYGNQHYGMLWLQDVKNDKMSFEYIYLHSGNNDDHSLGCILTGSTQQDLDLGKDGMIGRSRDAYKRMYDKVAKPILAGKKVTITVSSIDFGKPISNDSPPEMIHPDFIKEDISEIKGLMIQLFAKLEGKDII